MRFMIIVKATKDSEAGVLLDGSGLQASSKGWPKTREEAMEWARRFPNPSIDGKEAEIEVRQLFELEDFAPGEAVERFKDMGVGGKK